MTAVMGQMVCYNGRKIGWPKLAYSLFASRRGARVISTSSSCSGAAASVVATWKPAR